MCDDLVMYKCDDLVMYKCDDLVMYKCDDLVMHKCDDLVMYKCDDLVMCKCDDLVMYKCDDLVTNEYVKPDSLVLQVLITILDMARKSPCADVRVDELQRLKVNMRKFLEYGFPSATSWEELGWSGRSIDAITDNIISWISRKKHGDLRACGGRLLEEGAAGRMLVGAGTGSGIIGSDSEDIKVNGTPLKAS